VDSLVSNKLRLNSITMSRDVGAGPNSKSGKLTPERIATKRSAIILNERVGARLHVSNGLRFTPVSISSERVGHRFGEFSPTRKRPIPPSSKSGAKSTKPAVKKLILHLIHHGTKNASNWPSTRSSP
jgi:ribosomal protein S19